MNGAGGERIEEGLDILRAIIGMKAHRPENGLVNTSGKARIQFTRRSKHIRTQESLFRSHRSVTGKQVIQGGGEGIYIRPRVGVACVATILLEGSVQGGSSTLYDGDGHLVWDHLLN